ncbi:MAG: alpha/beta hydrolase [Leptospiraceae bacterium]|nr:alpha/beta hydrolase [Leptospiraceae bacterium]
MKEIILQVNGLQFSCLEAGEGDRLLLFAHGFPDTPYSYSELIEKLAINGYHCLAPFMRGYHPTEIPPRQKQNPDATIQVIELARDLCEITKQISHKDCILIGHDWGSVAAYAAANYSPKLFAGLITMAVPPIPVFFKNLLINPGQFLKSWYMLFFQLPFEIPESLVRLNNFAFVDNLWKSWSPRLNGKINYMSDVKAAIRNKSHLKSALAYYRGMFQPRLDELILWKKSLELVMDPITITSLVINGTEDGCIGQELFNGLEFAFHADFRHARLEGAGHFLPLEREKEVLQLILEFSQELIG